MPEKPSYDKFGKDTLIAHFSEIFQWGNQGKLTQKGGRLLRLEKHPGQLALSQYALKVQTSETILRQTAAPKVPAKPSFDKFGKDTQIAHFLRFFKGGTKGN